ncbi:MAG: hypothetical protein A2621_03810 [Alphaproteobacteria bacterium RIFCSPHIGHO2_01_FULL_41_14]|nr:MAG: hypothetical protein A2621_03810 [Alphaproteobacteria bacterium RIFCSPHIGHO2_01_FULL_41_14]
MRESMINYGGNGEKNMNLIPHLYGFFYVGLGIIFSILTVKLLRKIKNSPGIKNSFYEREQSFSFRSHQDFNVHFYTLGLLFLILISFSIFLFLWVSSSESSSPLGLLLVVFMMGIFSSGYIYAWKKGLFE